MHRINLLYKMRCFKILRKEDKIWKNMNKFDKNVKLYGDQTLIWLQKIYASKRYIFNENDELLIIKKRKLDNT